MVTNHPKRIRFAWLAIITAGVVCGYATPSTALDLWELWEQAKIKNAWFIAEKAEADARLAGTWQALAALGPYADLYARRTAKREWLKPYKEEAVKLEERFYQSDITLTLQQPVFDMGKFVAAKRAVSERKLSFWLLKKAESDTMLSVVEVYFAVLNAQNEMQLATAEQEALSRLATLTKEKYTLGMGTIIDWYDAEARFHLARAQELSAEDALEDAKNALSELLGEPVGDNLSDLNKTFLLPRLEKNIDQWITRSDRDNIELNIRRLESKQAKIDLAIAKSGHWPSITFNVDYTVEDADSGVNGYGERDKVVAYGLRMQMPFLRGGAVVSARVEAKRKYRAAKNRMEAERRSVLRSIKSTCSFVHSSYRIINALKLAIRASESALEAKKLGYEEGVSTALDVIDAQQNYFQDWGEYQKARYDYIIARLKLNKIAGSLDEEKIKTVNQWLN